MTFYLVHKGTGVIQGAVSEMPDPLPGNLIAVDTDVHPTPTSGEQTWDDTAKQWSAPLAPAKTQKERLSKLEAALITKGVLVQSDLD